MTDLIELNVLRYRSKQDRAHVKKIIELNAKFDQAFFAPSSDFCTETNRYYFRVSMLNGGAESDNAEFSAFGSTLQEAYDAVEKNIEQYMIEQRAIAEDMLKVQNRIDELLTPD